jgi:hypothetical protein
VPDETRDLAGGGLTGAGAGAGFATLFGVALAPVVCLVVDGVALPFSWHPPELARQTPSEKPVSSKPRTQAAPMTPLSMTRLLFKKRCIRNAVTQTTSLYRTQDIRKRRLCAKKGGGGELADGRAMPWIVGLVGL